MRNNPRLWLAAPVLGLLTLSAWGLTLKAPIFYDDVIYVRDHPLHTLPPSLVLKEVASRRYFPLTQERTYQPLITLFHYATHQSPMTYRLAGIAIHALNAWILFLLACRVLEPRQAWIVAILFALFPAHTEAVNISAFKGHLLSSTFILLTLLSWLKAESGSAWALGLCHFWLVAGLLCKETGLLAPALIFIHALSFRPQKAWRLMRRAAGLALIGAMYLAWRFCVLEQPLALVAHYGTSRARLAVESFGWYLRMLPVPYPLCLEHSWDYSTPAGILAACARWILPALFFGLLWTSRKDARSSFSLGWIFLGCLPVLHLIPFANYSPVADRYLYLPCAGFCLALGRLLSGPRLKFAAYALMLWWGGETISRNALYSDQEAFLKQTASCAPMNPRAQALLGDYYLYNTENIEAALSGFNKAFALDPELVTPFVEPGLIHVQKSDYVYGMIHMKTKDFKLAQEDFTRALPRAPTTSAQAAALVNIGDAALAQGKSQEAFKYYKLARQVLPDWFIPYLKGGTLLIKKDPARARLALETAKSMIGDWPYAAHYRFLAQQGLGEAYWKLGEKGQAIREWTQALDLEPDHLELMGRMAKAQASLGDKTGAIKTYALLASTADKILRHLAELTPPEASQSKEISDLTRSIRHQQTKALAQSKSLH